jgi:tetratricopeptide (TPR) repeat protein
MLPNWVAKLPRNFRPRRQWLVYAIGLICSLTILCCNRQQTQELNRDYGITANPVPLYSNLGSLQHPISTKSPQAQSYFNQGLTLVYGFNHGEAVRSFATAIKFDPDCAMCHWGIALALGPNINAGMKSENISIAWDEAKTALKLSDRANVTPAEKEYIQALQARYRPEANADRGRLDQAYAEAMQVVAQRYPQDADAATLYAEAVMDTSPWNYWDNGKPKAAISPAIAALETALKLDPAHPGAHHYYIHMMEDAPEPQKSLPSAETLGRVVPGIAHLVHMPSHIFQRVGRYREAVLANQQAIAADKSYIAKSAPTPDYYHHYVAHNYHFLWSSAVLSGQSKLAIDTAQAIAAQAGRDSIAPLGNRDNFAALPLYTFTRFGAWQSILATPKPKSKYVEGVWHYARGMALANTGKIDEANTELRSLQTISTAPDIAQLKIWDRPASKFLAVTIEDLSGTIAARERNYPTAIDHLTTAWQLANKLSYSEFGNWFSAIGYDLGKLLLQSGRATEAATVYNQELARYPENGYSLFGLAQSLKATGKKEEAKAVEQRFAKAWQDADFQL